MRKEWTPGGERGERESELKGKGANWTPKRSECPSDKEGMRRGGMEKGADVIVSLS